ncbi:MAG TPA: hypothetical protein VE978_15220 [Chitinophagales bacterium]|nr:hypothetical protein [Chitinophagales bacterium]
MKNNLLFICLTGFIILVEASCKKDDHSTVASPCSPADNTFSATGIIGSGNFDAVYGGAFGATYVVYSYVVGDSDSYIEIHLSNPLTAGVDTIPVDSIVPARPHLAGVIFFRDSIYEYGIPNQNVYVDIARSKTTITVCDLLMTDINNQDTILLTARVTN